jgi:transposase
MPRLTEVQRGQVIALLMQGQRQQKVALQFGVNVSTIERLVRRLKDNCPSSERYWKGCRRLRRERSRVTMPRQDGTSHLAHLRNRHVTVTETALTTVGNHNRHIHPKTVRNRLREFGLRARRLYIWFPLTRARRARRMAWLAAHGPRQFPMRQWRLVFFTDESRFTLFRPDGRRRVYRCRGEHFAEACVLERDRFWGCSVMVWGGISHVLKSPLIMIAGNIKSPKMLTLRFFFPFSNILDTIFCPLLMLHSY